MICVGVIFFVTFVLYFHFSKRTCLSLKRFIYVFQTNETNLADIRFKFCLKDNWVLFLVLQIIKNVNNIKCDKLICILLQICKLSFNELILLWHHIRATRIITIYKYLRPTLERAWKIVVTLAFIQFIPWIPASFDLPTIHL